MFFFVTASTWSCPSLELEAGLELHQDFNDVFHLIEQDRPHWKIELWASICIDSLKVHS